MTRCCALLLFAASGLGTMAGASAPPPMAGAYAAVPVSDEGVLEAARYAVHAQSERIAAVTGEPAELELVEVVAAERQVVSGLNYRLTIKVNMHAKLRSAAVTVWSRAWLKARPYELTAWRWQ